ncbi:PH domain-containing protein [Nocardia bovistercoris]|uniref:PH domain-containing protein n=1 Tax=Nocardia bovistercoris TaxID=2785916 RepID=A0A931I776_9NOCA|nr:PH domain-containing protein [Nocardia bovistercoris]MBH0775914.1 PH domain-containing protein [Nocardia bovistercoris]
MSQPRTILADPAWRPSPRAKLLWAMRAGLFWMIPIAVALVLTIVTSGRWQPITLAVLVALGLFNTVAVPLWRYAVHRWEVTDDAVYTRVGWLSQAGRVAPLSRVQTVDTERGPLERWLRLATVTVTTASSAGAVRIEGLDLAVAEQTVTRLTEIAALHRGDAT